MARGICSDIRAAADNLRMCGANAWGHSHAVGLYITAAYYFTASTSFANPTVTIARALSDTYAGIAPAGVPAFVVAQLFIALAAVAAARWLFGK